MERDFIGVLEAMLRGSKRTVDWANIDVLIPSINLRDSTPPQRHTDETLRCSSPRSVLLCVISRRDCCTPDFYVALLLVCQKGYLSCTDIIHATDDLYLMCMFQLCQNGRPDAQVLDTEQHVFACHGMREVS